MRYKILLLIVITAIIVALSIVLPSKPDLPTYQGMEHFTRNGQSINGTATWTITEIDPAYFSYLSNATIIQLTITGNLTNTNEGSFYINNHFLGTVNASQSVYKWNVPVDFCNSTTVIKITSEEWNVKSVDLMLFVEISQVPPWWKQNILILLLVVFVEIAIAVISARKVIKWIRAESHLLA
jgi:hypothetical protein